MRHSYATAALAAGIPAKMVSERLGHANVAITLDTYSHVIPGMDEQAAATVADLILAAEGPGTVSRARPLTMLLTTAQTSDAPHFEGGEGRTSLVSLVAGEGFEPSTSGL